MYVKKVKKLKLSLWQRIRLHFILCANICSIHGFSHVVRKNISIFERILWVAVIVAAATWCIVIATEAIDRYQTRPTVITVEKDKENWQIPFPTTTICPKNIDENKANELIRQLMIEDGDAFKKFVTNLATTNFEDNFGTNKYAKYPWYEQSDSYLDWVNRTKHTPEDHFDIEQNFGSIGRFETTISETGSCLVYNSQIAYYNTLEYWNLNTRKLKKSDPYITLNITNLKPAVTLNNIMGPYTIYFHGPNELPSMTTVGTFSELSTFATFELSITIVYGPPEVQALKISQRQCRFRKESNLRHFPVYSYNLCTMECRINLCLKLCNCVPYYYKRIGDEKVCGPSGMKCWLKHKNFLTRLLDKEGNSACSCIPICSTVDLVILKFETMDWVLGTNAKWYYSEFPNVLYKRSLIYTNIHLYLQIGGVASFFLGVSILSLIEIVYFLTLRFYWAVFRGKLF